MILVYLNALAPYMLGLVAVYVAFHVIPQYAVDRFRQHLFMRRDELFLKAAKGEISFQSKAYQLTRNRINMLLRHAEHISFVNILLYSRLQPEKVRNDRSKQHAQQIRQSLSALPGEQRELIELVNRTVDYAIAQHLALNSSFISLFLLPFSLLLVLFKKLKSSIYLSKPVQRYIETADIYAGTDSVRV